MDLIGPFTRSPRLVFLSNSCQGLALALLHAQADAALVFADFQNHDFDFVAQRNQLVGSDVLVGPVHFGHVHQAFDAGFEFDERAVVGDVRDLAEQAGALG